MSEFSDAYYLLATDTATAESAVKKLSRFGLILPPSGRWLPVLIEDAGEAGDAILDFGNAASFVWLHYAFGADHGLFLRVFDRAQEVVSIKLQRRGPSELPDPDAIDRLAALGVFPANQAPTFYALLEAFGASTVHDTHAMRESIGRALSLELAEWTSCADLTRSSVTELSKRFLGARMVLKSRRGKTKKEAVAVAPNEYCPVPDLPAFMYLPVPDPPSVDESMLQRHMDHWLDGMDWDEEKQEGMWLYMAYCDALPSRVQFLANRVMNLHFFGDSYEPALRQTIRAILGSSPPDFDWIPYLERRKGTIRL